MSAYLVLIDWQRGVGELQRPFMRTPMELLQPQSVGPRPVQVQVWQIEPTHYGVVLELTVAPTPETIAQCLSHIGAHLPTNSRVFSVHTKSLLGRIALNWAVYRGFPDLAWLTTAELHDIIELVNTPAVLSLPEREIWSPALLEWATGITSRNPMEQLHFLCIPHLQIPRISTPYAFPAGR